MEIQGSWIPPFVRNHWNHLHFHAAISFPWHTGLFKHSSHKNEPQYYPLITTNYLSPVGWPLVSFLSYLSISLCLFCSANCQLHSPNQHLVLFQFSSVQSLSCVLLLATPWTAARQASLSITNSQTHIHLGSDAIQPSHPLPSPFPPAPNPSQHQSFFQWVNSSNEVAKVLEFQL